MAAPDITRVTFQDHHLTRGVGRKNSTKKTIGFLHGNNICSKLTIDDMDADVKTRVHAVSVSGYRGNVTWTGMITTVISGSSIPIFQFELENNKNDQDADPGSGEETVSVTVVSPDNGTSKSVDTQVNVLAVE